MSRRRDKDRQGFFGSGDDMTMEEAANLIYSDPAMLDELDRRRVKIEPILSSEVAIYQEIQVRVTGLDPGKVEQYKQVLINGGEFKDPIDVFYDEEREEWILADGFHRCEADRLARLEAEQDPAIRIKPLRARKRFMGGYAAALEYAEDANLAHGKALSAADKRAIFERRLQRGHEWAMLSDRQIAGLLGVSHPTIGAWRRALEQDVTGKNLPVTRTYITKHGTPATMNTSKIRDANQQRSIEPEYEPGSNLDDAEPAGQWDDWNDEPDEPTPPPSTPRPATSSQDPVKRQVLDHLRAAADGLRRLRDQVGHDSILRYADDLAQEWGLE